MAKTISVKIELTPLGKVIIRLCRELGTADRALFPDSVLEAIKDVLALDEEGR